MNKMMVNILSIFSFVYLLCDIYSVGAAGRVVSDWRIQDKRITPVLGRGYSVATGSLQSSCMIVNARTNSTYDYDFFFTEINEDSAVKSSIDYNSKWTHTHKGRDHNSKLSVQNDGNFRSERNTNKRTLVATMMTDRYYTSVDENEAELNDDARSLLESGQYMSFFQACGPNYIRSIQRRAEIHATFEFTSSSDSRSSQFMQTIKSSYNGWRTYSRGWFRSRGKISDDIESGSTYKSKLDSDFMRNELTIKIEAFGLALNEDGAASLVANSMEDLKKVMDFAFQSMQTVTTGMVEGIEIVPWVDNPTFQVAAGLTDVLQECGDDEKKKNIKDDGEENDVGGLFNDQNQCRTLPMEVKKMALSNNGEYVATMNRVLRAQMDNFYNMQQCRTMLEMFTNDDKDKFLVNHVDGMESIMTVENLKSKISVKVMETAQENNNKYIKYFYSPCMEALTKEYGGQIGATSMIKNWFSIPECQNMACTVQGTNVDEKGKCTFDDNDDTRVHVEQYCMPLILPS